MIKPINLEMVKPVLTRLTMIYGSGICQLCETPEGDTRTFSINWKVDPSNKCGYYTCGKDECQKSMEQYISLLYSEIYESRLWNLILHKIANRIFVSVKRSSGLVDNDWKLKINEYITSNTNLDIYPLNTLFITAMLCVRHLGINIPSEIWEHMYYEFALQSYTPYVHLIIASGMEKYIMVYKENKTSPLLNIEKLVNIKTLCNE